MSKRASRRKALQKKSKVKSPELSLFLRNNSRSDQERDTVRKKLQFWRESSVVPAISVVGVSTPSPTSSSSASASASAVAPPAQEEEQHEEEQHEEEQHEEEQHEEDQQEAQQEQEGNFQGSIVIGSSVESGCMVGRSIISDSKVSGDSTIVGSSLPAERYATASLM